MLCFILFPLAGYDLFQVLKECQMKDFPALFHCNQRLIFVITHKCLKRVLRKLFLEIWIKWHLYFERYISQILGGNLIHYSSYNLVMCAQYHILLK